MERGGNTEFWMIMWKRQYCTNVRDDIEELKKYYPFTSYIMPPTMELQPVHIRTIAADARIIKATNAIEQDFLGEYSKELEIIVPYDYKITGCQVYGGKWIDKRKLTANDVHFYDKNSNGQYLFCVGVPASFSKLKNVILENVRTAHRMLVAYELLQSGKTEKLELIAYAHGDEGCNEYEREAKKYKR